MRNTRSSFAVLCASALAALSIVATISHAVTIGAAASLSTARSNHSATQMTNGKLLVVGGQNGSGTPLTSVEIYDPFANAWSAGAALAAARSDHTATLLDNGRVLIVGGRSTGSPNALNTAQLYDASTNTWIGAGNLATARSGHTATRLRNGKILVVGGQNNGTTLASAEIYDPATNAWASAGAMATARQQHTATASVGLVEEVWVIGGSNNSNARLRSIERYSATSNSWSTFTAQLNDERHSHTATALTNGDIVIAGGGTFALSGLSVVPESLSGVEVIRVATNTIERLQDMSDRRMRHSATLLPSGKLMVMGGVRDGPTLSFRATVEIYDPASGVWSLEPNMPNARANHTATLIPTGAVLAVGGQTAANAAAAATTIARTETYSSTLSTGGSCGERSQAATTLLADGRVLMTGGVSSLGVLSDAFIFNPSTQACTAVSSMPFARRSHTLTLLPSGNVLAVGGFAADDLTPTATSALYDPSAGVGGTWTSLPALPQTNAGHTATLLQDGRVMVFGGRDVDLFTNDLIQYFDPASSAWSTMPAGVSVGVARSSTLLPDGRVFFTSGGNIENCETSLPAFVLNPATNTINIVTSAVQRCAATATLLANGKVLIIGGFDAVSRTRLAIAELFDPATLSSTLVPSLTIARYRHTAALLVSGEVVVAGGSNVDVTTTEIYDPVSNSWRAGPALQKMRFSSTAVAHPSGKVVVFSGMSDVAVGTPEIIGVNPFPNLAVTPMLNAPSVSLGLNANTTFSGSGFRPAQAATGGDNQQSASNAPVLEIQRIDNGQRRFFSQAAGSFLAAAPSFTNSTFTASADSLAGFPRGHAFVRAWVNGVPSEAKSVLVATTPDAPLAPTASATSITSATVTFNTAPFFNGGSALTKYGVENEAGDQVGSCTMPCTNIVVTGLTPGSIYRFRVFAANALGEGARSPLSNSVTLPGRSSSTAVTSSQSPAYRGRPITLIATVTVAGGAALAGGGTMRFTANGTEIAGCGAVSVTLVGGNNTASCTTTTLGVQNWNINATFSGDAQTSFSFGTVVQSIYPVPSLNIDESTAPNTANDAATDGLMISRYLAGFTGTAITNNAMGATATRMAQDVPAYLESIRGALDVNGDNRFDLAIDGLLIVRYMQGLRLATGLFNGIDVGTVMTTAQIQTYLQLLMP